MISNKHLKYIAIFLVCFSAPLFSQDEGQKIADKYREVERLIGILDYNQAINILVDIVKEDPEEMEKAQKMIKDIREKKEEFNKKYEELITVLFEENDYNKGLQIIDELEQLDKNPNPATENTIREARLSAELIYFRLLFNETMDRAYQFILDGKYDEAVRTYLTGFNFHKRTYNEREYGEIIKGPVDSELELLMTATSAFLDGYGNLKGINETRIVEENPASFQNLNQYYSLFTDFSDFRNAVWHAGWTFNNQNKLLGEISTEFNEDFFLSFAWRLVYGRTNVDHEEGLIVAMDSLWKEKLHPVQEQLNTILLAVMERADTAYGQENWRSARQVYENALPWAEEAVRYNRLWGNIINLDEQTNLTGKSLTLFQDSYGKLRDYTVIYRKIELFDLLCQYNQRLASYAVYNDQDFELMSTRREILGQEIANLLPPRDEWDAMERETGENPFITEPFTGQTISASLQALNTVQNNYEVLKGEVSLAMADYEFIPLEQEYQRISSDREYVLSLLNGLSTGQGDELDILYVYPERVLTRLETLSGENGALREDLNRFLDDYRPIREDIPQKDALSVYLDKVQQYLDALAEAEAEYDDIAGKADQKVVQAERYLNEGEYRFRQAENALNRKDFRQAVQELTTAQDLFVQALSYNEDIISREDTDKRIQALQEQILFEENREVIRFVRDNVNEGKSLYLQGRYAQSETTLLRAESRWFTTNTEPNSEINYWLNLVRAALSVESGRTIEDTEPLYAEMTQFLNLAYSNFEKGRILVEKGNITDGLKYLDMADQNLNEILIPMPLNQAASVLKLKIQQIRDPDLFREIFSEKFKSAVSRLRNKPDEAYMDLKDLAEIQSDYPGIKRAIYDAEIILGIRVPPPNPANLRESEDLYQKAYVIVEGNVRSQFPVALAQLEKAIELNPENSSAIELKDRIQLDAGGQTTIVLSSAAQSQFKIAEEKYINGDYFEAYAIVQQLLKDKDNASYTPLQDLKRRIESKF